MSRFKGSINLVCDNEKVYDNFLIRGIKSSNKIIYKENDISVTIFLKDNKIEMKRETNDYIINMCFDEEETIGSYYLKKENKGLDLKIITKTLHYDNKYIELEYLLYIEKELTGHFKFSLKEV